MNGRTRRKALRAAAAALVLAVLLGACGGTTPPAPSGQELTPGQTNTEPAPAENGEPSAPAEYTPGQYDMVPYGEMTYQRPDMDVLERLFTSAQQLAEEAGSGDGRAVTDKLKLCWEAYDEFYTMETLAMLHADADLTDEEWAEEYAFCLTSETRLEQWMDSLLTACAASAARVERYLLAGYDQQDSEPYSQRLVELMEQEDRLLLEYRDAMALEEIQLDGRTVNYTDLISNPWISEETYQAANLAYCRACNEAAAPIYVELIRTRRAMAAELGYDSYEAYQYDAFARDYTPQQTAGYLDAIAAAVPGYYRSFVRQEAQRGVDYKALSSRKLLSLLESAVSGMSDTVEEAMSFMREYQLYDVTVSAKKAPGAYTIYLPSYRAPFCFLGAYGDYEDYLDLAHEFGHFADAFCNEGSTLSLDLNEFYSQAMANLVLLRSRELVSADTYENLVLLHLLTNLNVFTDQAAYADFERRAYQLPDGELTVESLNALALSSFRRFGSDTGIDDEICSLYWAQVSHLFESPFYVISYCVSADAALQVLQRELDEPGSGLAAYDAVLHWRQGAFLYELERSGLESPFSPGRIESDLALADAVRESVFRTSSNAA